MRIYADEAGTHADDWLVIGMLFVPNHGPLHSELLRVKKEKGYFNRSPKRDALYKESTLKDTRTHRDVDVAREWFKAFCASDAYFRAIVIDWSIWDGSHFGDPFEPDALKRRRAYKKWAEQLLQGEFAHPLPDHQPIRRAQFYLDRLRVMYGYDLLDHLDDRFKRNYEGQSPFIETFQHTTSWKDANQCLQLCDLMVGSIYQTLVPSKKKEKLAIRDSLAASLKPLGAQRIDAGYWKQYHHTTLRQRHPRFCVWYWQPEHRRGGAKKAGWRKTRKRRNGGRRR
jgi:hypothetical protein